MITSKILRNYLFKIIASEDWRGVRQDYSVGSDTVKFRSVAGAGAGLWQECFFTDKSV